MADSTLKQSQDEQQANMANPMVAKLGNIYKAITITETSSGESLIDPMGQGRIAAYIPALGQGPDDPMIFKHASTGSIFHVPDRTGITVLVFFADMDSTRDAFWFATTDNVVDVVAGGPLGNPHIDGSGIGEGAYVDVAVMKDFTEPEDTEKDGAELPNSAFNKILADQGTLTDDHRGPTTSSPIRDAGYETVQHAKVMGFKTSGGSSVSIDDGSISDDGTIHAEQIKITTSSGAAITCDGGNDFIYIVNSTGSGWVEIGAGGEVMVYAEGSLNMRTQKDFNLRADKNINIESGEDINIHSFGTTKINTDKEMHVRSIGNQFLQSESGMNVNVGVNCVVTTGSILHLNGPLAPESELILTSDMPDIEDLEATELKKTIISELPTHEPFIRPHANDPDTSAFAKLMASKDGLEKSGLQQ
tara:strand:- start:671 stop:1924 length:1254 start_codon:yes stop_codon:yes gene_type:complete